MAQISLQLAHGSLSHQRRHFFFFLATSQWVSSTAHPPYSALAEGCLAVYSSESLNKSACNWGDAKELEEEKRETKTATGESVSISCRWSRDAIQLLLVLLLLLLRKESGGEKGRGYYSGREREWEKKLVLESVSVREKTLRTKERRCSAEDNQRGRNRERERERATDRGGDGGRERETARERGRVEKILPCIRIHKQCNYVKGDGTSGSLYFFLPGGAGNNTWQYYVIHNSNATKSIDHDHGAESNHRECCIGLYRAGEHPLCSVRKTNTIRQTDIYSEYREEMETVRDTIHMYVLIIPILFWMWLLIGDEYPHFTPVYVSQRHGTNNTVAYNWSSKWTKDSNVQKIE